MTILNGYLGVNGKIIPATDPIIDTDPALTPLMLRPRCYVNGSIRRAYLVSVYQSAAGPLAYAAAAWTDHRADARAG